VIVQKRYYSAPALVDISLTRRCNLKCSYCYASGTPDADKNEELHLENFSALFNDLDSINTHRIALSGGEPFMREDFFNILDLTQRHKFAKIINTNGMLIKDDIAKKLSTYDIDRICVTIDGSNSTMHDSLRGEGSFAAAIEGIANLQKCRLPVSTLYTLTNDNVGDLINTIKLNESLGMEYMSVMVVCPTGRASDGSSLLTPEVWYPLFLKLTEMKMKGEIKLSFKIVPPNESRVFWLFYYPLKHYNKLDLLSVWNQSITFAGNNRDVSCQAGIAACSIAHNGDVYGCDLMMGIDEFKAGNVKDKSIKDIWNHSSVFSTLRNLKYSDLQGKCARCKNIWCGGGCRSAAFNLTGTITGADDSCFEKGDEYLNANER